VTQTGRHRQKCAKLFGSLLCFLRELWYTFYVISQANEKNRRKASATTNTITATRSDQRSKVSPRTHQTEPTSSTKALKMASNDADSKKTEEEVKAMFEEEGAIVEPTENDVISGRGEFALLELCCFMTPTQSNPSLIHHRRCCQPESR